MTKDDIIHMAREAKFATEEWGDGLRHVCVYNFQGSETEITEELQRFASLVASAERDKHKWDIHSCSPTCNRYACVATREAVLAEREACAKVCEPKRPRPCDCEYCDCGNSSDKAAVVDWDSSNALATAIRARGQA